MHKRKKPWSNVGIGLSFIGTIAVGGYSLKQLRRNNLTMLELRDKVIEADTTGIGVYDALGQFSSHIAAHMNTTPPKLGKQPALQLKGTYDRAVQAEIDRVSKERTAIANDAAVFCETNVRNVQLSVRADCVAEYISARPVTEKTVVSDLYKYDFVSPVWSADAAGWSLLVCVVLAGLFVIQVLSRLIALFIIKK